MQTAPYGICANADQWPHHSEDSTKEGDPRAGNCELILKCSREESYSFEEILPLHFFLHSSFFLLISFPLRMLLITVVFMDFTAENWLANGWFLPGFLYTPGQSATRTKEITHFH